MAYTGERLITHINTAATIEHLHRYAIALELAEGKDVLDIACGEGYGSNFLAGTAKSAVGIDIDIKVIDHATGKYKKNNLKFLQGSVDNIPLDTKSIDLIVSFETIEHHDKHEKMLQEFKRVLKPDGIIIISSPDKLNNLNRSPYINPYHIKELYLDEFRELINRYFKYSQMFCQRTLYSSVIIPEEEVTSSFKYYSGDFTKLDHSSKLKDPIFNICIASDSYFIKNLVSIFDGMDILDKVMHGDGALSKLKKVLKSFLIVLKKRL